MRVRASCGADASPVTRLEIAQSHLSQMSETERVLAFTIPCVVSYTDMQIGVGGRLGDVSPLDTARAAATLLASVVARSTARLMRVALMTCCWPCEAPRASVSPNFRSCACNHCTLSINSAAARAAALVPSVSLCRSGIRLGMSTLAQLELIADDPVMIAAASPSAVTISCWDIVSPGPPFGA